MSAPILAFHDGTSKPKVTAHLLPCRVHHDGSVGELPEYWVADSSQDGKRVAFFRGRSLHGKVAAVPDEYRGLVVSKGASPPDTLEERRGHNGDEQDITAPIQVSAEFTDVVLWGHETVVETSTDPHLRSVDEWLEVSKKIHDFPSKSTQVVQGK